MQPTGNPYLPPDYTPTQSGGSNKKSIVVIVLAITAIILAGLAIWGFMQYFSLNEEFEQRVAVRVEEAKEEQKKADQAEFEEIQKSPYRTYSAPGFVGNFSLKYPKSWSLYVEESERGRLQLDGIAHPKLVPTGNANETVRYAFRFELRSEIYDDALEDYDRRIESGDAQARSIKVSNILATRIEGEISNDVNGTVVLLPIRDKTLFLFNENPKYIKDFNAILSKAKINP